MADAADLLPGLPNDIAIWEILIRLPPKPLLRSRAVSPAWRRDFLLSHHARQPALQLLESYSDDDDDDRRRPVTARRATQNASLRGRHSPHVSGGLPRRPPPPLPLSLRVVRPLHLHLQPGNSAVRSPPPPQGIQTSGHTPSTGGDYRLLLYRLAEHGAHVFTLGSAEPPRRIPCPRPLFLGHSAGILFRGSIYWYTHRGILIFDTTNESFRRIRAPPASHDARVFLMGDMLALFGPNDQGTAIDIWVMPNRQQEVWDFKCRVKLPVAETRQQCRCSEHDQVVMVVPGDDGGLLMLISCDKWLFQVDIDGNLIASFHTRGLSYTHQMFKQTLVQHTFFPTLEGYVVNAPPFI
ncbi:hypothetical protein CFC21_085753 [Triticum aestivum]|uniref:F-box associated beta-propeller type 3 domain-containing protein n=2 Tax=Triticum aestivum TaxID=4565 RepID=A0A9R1L8S9_WHEAT|nr:hypothetical protein CFC21_085753 [Triticum aestivum]